MQSFLLQLRQHLDAFLPRHHQATVVALSLLLLILLTMQALQWQAPDELVHDETLAPLAQTATAPAERTVPVPHAEPTLAVPAELGPPAPDDRLFLTVEPGDNLSLLFKRAGLGPAEVQMLADAGSDGKVLASLHPGQQLAFDMEKGEAGTVLHSVELIRSPLESYVFHRHTPARFSATRILRQPHLHRIFRLFGKLLDALVPVCLIQCLVRIGQRH